MKCLGREHKGLEKRGVKILAISADTAESHARFGKALGLRFDLLADTDLAVARRYGVFAQTPQGGFATRSVFLIDREGKLCFVDRDFRVPRKLAGTPLAEALDALADPSDPLAALDPLPEPERSGKTVLGRLILAALAEDRDGIAALLHADFGVPPGGTATKPSARDRFLTSWEKTFAEEDLARGRFEDVLSLDAALVLDRDAATAAALRDYGSDVRALAVRLQKEELLVVARGAGLRSDDGTPILSREIALILRKDGDEWRIAALSGR